MPLATSDFRNPICMEMKMLRSARGLEGGPMDIGSVDSSDTYASCNTQPFNSQGDLTDDIPDGDADPDVDGSNLYVNPMESPRSIVKKSASGDTALRSLGDTTLRSLGDSALRSLGDNALRSLGASPLEEAYKGFGPTERGSRGSLNDTPLPKHRKTRFQQPRFGGDTDGQSQESLETIKRRRPSFMPTRSLATATRIINQHLFGLQSSLSRQGKNGESRTSLSVDSIDSRTCQTPETHRRSKSILKKHESHQHQQAQASCGNHRGTRQCHNDDPEMEKLISDTASGASGSDYSPGKSPPSLRAIGPLPANAHTQTPKQTPLPLKFVGIATPGTVPSHSEVTLLHDLLGSSAPVPAPAPSPPPLYICPPPPPMDHSPTEETKLLLHQADLKAHRSLHSS